MEASAKCAGWRSGCVEATLQKPGAFKKGTIAHVPSNLPSPPAAAKVECDWPPMTGSFITLNLRLPVFGSSSNVRSGSSGAPSATAARRARTMAVPRCQEDVGK